MRRPNTALPPETAAKMIVYQSKKHGLSVTFVDEDPTEPLVELTLGSEVRTSQLCEFTNFWLDMVEKGRKVVTAQRESLEELPRLKNG